MLLDLNAVIVAVTGNQPRVVTVAPAEHAADGPALPSGELDLEGDLTLELGLRRLVADQAGVDIGYVEQLYTFGDRYRDPHEAGGGPRLISIAYLALVRETSRDGRQPGAGWDDCYRFLPWEDRRGGSVPDLARLIAGALEQWVSLRPAGSATRRARERLDLAFGLGGVEWDPERCLERYELLYEAGLVAEAQRDRAIAGSGSATGATQGVQQHVEPGGMGTDAAAVGEAMAHDHRRILATALGRIRGKLKYRPVVFELVQSSFTLLELQHVVEALAGVTLHKGNFRRLLDRSGLVEGTRRTRRTGGRPAELFRFRRDVLRERSAPGVGMPRV